MIFAKANLDVVLSCRRLSSSVVGLKQKVKAKQARNAARRAGVTFSIYSYLLVGPSNHEALKRSMPPSAVTHSPCYVHFTVLHYVPKRTW